MFVQRSTRDLCALMLVLILALFVLDCFSIAALSVAILLLVLGYFAYGGILALPALTAKKIAACLLAGYFALLLIAGFCLAVEPAWDFGRVYSGALDLAEHGQLTYTLQYFLESNNNFFIAYLLSYWFKIASLFGIVPLYAGIVLNCIAIWVSVAVLFWVACKEWSVQRGLMFLTVAVCFVPLYTYAAIFYTDTLSLPFISTGIFLWQQLRRKPNFWLLLLLGANAFVGYQLKASAGILYVAMFIFLAARGGKKAWKRILIVGLTIALLCAGYRSLLAATQVIDLTELDRYQLPYTHYLMMGLAGVGGYNAADYELSTGIEDLATRKQTNIAEIKTRLADYGVVGYLSFLAGKIEYTWLDGTYYAPYKLSIDPLHTNFLSAFFRTDGAYYNLYKIIALGGQLALLLLMLCALHRAERLTSLLALSVFGLFLFLLLWETRSRYLLNFTPMFLLLAQVGMHNLYGRLQTFAPTKKEKRPTATAKA